MRIRKRLGASVAAALLFAPAVLCGWQQSLHPGKWDAITDVPGVRIGHYTVRTGTLRGTTAALFDGGGICGLDVRGGNPGTIGDSIYNTVNIGEECDAVVFSGGSLYGLVTAGGVTDFLAEHGKGIQTAHGLVPSVPGAVIYDLRMDDKALDRMTLLPKSSWGYEAAKAAVSGPLERGNIGAGAGGTIGKWARGIPMKGGLGSASLVLPNGVIVGALVIVNALGDVVNPQTGRFFASEGGFDQPIFEGPEKQRHSQMNTTLVLIATDAELSKVQLTRVAQLAHDGLARVIRPIHTMLDGDSAYAVSVGIGHGKKLDMESWEATDLIGNAGADLTVRAVLNAVQAAQSVPGFPSYTDWKRSQGAK